MPGWTSGVAISRIASRRVLAQTTWLADEIGQMPGGPAVGLVGREYGVRTAISVAAMLLAPAVWLYRRACKY